MIPIMNPKQQLESIQDEVMKDFKDVLASGQYILGENVDELEASIARRLGVRHAIGVGSGTDALILTLHAYGIGVGDEVITTPFSFFATAAAISRVGAIPVFADVDEKTFNIDPQEIHKHITSKTKAIIPVHLFGQPAKMDAINQIAETFNLIVIEDACQAFGATFKEQAVGNLGDAACFSFFPTKNLGAIGDGGMITTSDDDVAHHIRKLRVHGSQKKYYHEEIGYNSRLDEVQAAILRTSLKYIDRWNRKRQVLASRYYWELKDVPTIQPPQQLEYVTHVYHLYCLKSLAREQIIEHLAKHNIHTGIYYPRCIHLQHAYKDLGYDLGDFPIAELLSEQLFAIPLYPHLSFEDQDVVISALKNFEVSN
ncbi:MAG TPA: DegT/DnrJ/EryC1/StrS family aminotransferase [Virgibacillus sp.]|nr:DegT/DnrJ/EryC1/StrS family aminotransferase [Virgibacillus sp.]